MKDVAKAINELTHQQGLYSLIRVQSINKPITHCLITILCNIPYQYTLSSHPILFFHLLTTTVVDFMNDGVMLVCEFELTKEDVVVKREFSGDTKRYEATVSEDGSLMIAIDATCDEEVLQELRAKTVAATVQRLRKSCGLVVGDRVEIFYEEGAGKASESAIGLSLAKHAATTIARIKSLPLPMALCSPQAIVIVKEVVNDPDISKSPVTIVLTQVINPYNPFVTLLDFVQSQP